MRTLNFISNLLDIDSKYIILMLNTIIVFLILDFI